MLPTCLSVSLHSASATHHLLFALCKYFTSIALKAGFLHYPHWLRPSTRDKLRSLFCGFSMVFRMVRSKRCVVDNFWVKYGIGRVFAGCFRVFLDSPRVSLISLPVSETWKKHLWIQTGIFSPSISTSLSQIVLSCDPSGTHGTGFCLSPRLLGVLGYPLTIPLYPSNLHPTYHILAQKLKHASSKFHWLRLRWSWSFLRSFERWPASPSSASCASFGSSVPLAMDVRGGGTSSLVTMSCWFPNY